MNALCALAANIEDCCIQRKSGSELDKQSFKECLHLRQDHAKEGLGRVDVESFESDLTHNDTTVILLWKKDCLVAYCAFGPDMQSLHIHELHVRDGFRRLGLASALDTVVHQEALDRCLPRSLACDEKNLGGRKFWEFRGWTPSNGSHSPNTTAPLQYYLKARPELQAPFDPAATLLEFQDYCDMESCPYKYEHLLSPLPPHAHALAPLSLNPIYTCSLAYNPLFARLTRPHIPSLHSSH